VIRTEWIWGDLTNESGGIVGISWDIVGIYWDRIGYDITN
jgi:hypothetical protein